MKTTKDEAYIYLDDKGKAIGLEHETETRELIKVKRKDFEVQLNNTGHVGEKSKDKVKLEKELHKRIQDPKDPLTFQDLESDGKNVKVKK